MDSHEGNPAGGVIGIDPTITPLVWALDAKPAMPSNRQMAKNVSNNRCAKCGCWLQYKSILRAEKCPINKWE